MFARHHYLSHYFHPSAKLYLGLINGNIAGMSSLLHFPHNRIKNFKQIHRVVVLPDYQGLNLGRRLTNFIASLWTSKGYRIIITTSHPAMIHTLRCSPEWIMTAQGRVDRKGRTSSRTASARSVRRLTTSWEYVEK